MPPDSTPAAAADQGTSRALEALHALLIPGEQLETWAIQHRLFGLTHRRRIVGATSGRLVAVARGLLGGFTTQDIRWQDLDDAQLQVGGFAATLTVKAFASSRAKSGGIQLAGGTGAAAGSGDDGRDPAPRLQRARVMLQQGLLTDAEFEQVKARILSESVSRRDPHPPARRMP